jgi:hypothetical protein
VVVRIVVYAITPGSRRIRCSDSESGRLSGFRSNSTVRTEGIGRSNPVEPIRCETTPPRTRPATSKSEKCEPARNGTNLARLESVTGVARTIERRLGNPVICFRRLITKAVAEGLNCRIMSLKYRTGGPPHPGWFKTAICVRCGLAPVSP